MKKLEFKGWLKYINLNLNKTHIKSNKSSYMTKEKVLKKVGFKFMLKKT